MNKQYLMGLALALGTPTAMAGDNSPTYTQCMDNASSTVAMSGCIQAETQLQDAQLNRVYKQLLAKLEAAPRSARALRYSRTSSASPANSSRSALASRW